MCTREGVHPCVHATDSHRCTGHQPVVRGPPPAGRPHVSPHWVCVLAGRGPAEHAPQNKYRVPGFLGTLFSEDVAQEFLDRAHVLKQWPAVKWVIELDPRGEQKVQFQFPPMVRETQRVTPWRAVHAVPKGVPKGYVFAHLGGRAADLDFTPPEA